MRHQIKKTSSKKSWLKHQQKKIEISFPDTRSCHEKRLHYVNSDQKIQIAEIFLSMISESVVLEFRGYESVNLHSIFGWNVKVFANSNKKILLFPFYRNFSSITAAMFKCHPRAENVEKFLNAVEKSLSSIPLACTFNNSFQEVFQCWYEKLLFYTNI